MASMASLQLKGFLRGEQTGQTWLQPGRLIRCPAKRFKESLGNMVSITAVLQIEMQGGAAMTGKAEKKCFDEFHIKGANASGEHIDIIHQVRSIAEVEYR